jgi:hypothetical protein
MRVNGGQELVIGGYTPGAKNVDALVIGYNEGDKLLYAPTRILHEKGFKAGDGSPHWIRSYTLSNESGRVPDRFSERGQDMRFEQCTPVLPEGSLRHLGPRRMSRSNTKYTTGVVADEYFFRREISPDPVGVRNPVQKSLPAIVVLQALFR